MSISPTVVPNDSADITPNTVRKIAQLARLALAPETVPNYALELTHIFHLVAQLQATDLDGVEPLHNPLEMSQRLRLDGVTEGDQRPALAQNAPAWEQDLFIVPKVVE